MSALSGGASRHCGRTRAALSTKPLKRAVVAAAAAAIVSVATAQTASAAYDVVEKSISDITAGYTGGTLTVNEVVQAYLARIAQYDSKSGPAAFPVNSVAQINPNLAAAVSNAQSLINSGATTAQYPLLGVPVIVKNSYDVAGMTTTNGVSVLNGVGTPGSTTLIAPDDSFNVAKLKAAGAVILGKAALSTMAYSYNGIDNANGVVLNPYNGSRQPGGSSSGTGASIASNFAMLGMGGETGGSIRVPANHNALVGLKTTAGLINPEGTWPLTPARDVVGPLAKTVKDVAIAMNALVGPSSNNLFDSTPFYSGAPAGSVRPVDYTAGLSTTALQGKILAVPKSMYNVAGKNYEGNVHPLVMANFNTALDDLRAQGATVVFVDIPASDKYYTTIGRPNASGGPTTVGFGYDYPTTTVGGTTPSSTWSSWSSAYYYNSLIESYGDPTVKNIRDFATALYNGLPKDINGNPVTGTNAAATATIVTPGAGDPNSDLRSAYNNINNLALIWEAGNAKGFGDADNDGNPDNPDAIKALQAFKDLRVAEYEAFMQNPSLVDDPTTAFDESTVSGIDAFVAPTFAGVVPLQTAILPAGTTDPFAIAGSSFGSLLGRFESNILGVPSLSVPMGYTPDGTPMGIQFFDEFLGEEKLLALAYDYEQATMWRYAPNLDLLAVPEPTTLVAIGSLSLVALRRRRA